jgi:hypothetical protein
MTTPLSPRFAAASRPFPGESECGDQWAIETRGDQTFMALADGVGHGPAAAVAAKRAVQLARGSGARTLAEIILACHTELIGTRGVVMTLLRCCTRTGTLTHCGVGNVELNGLTATPIRPITTSGIVGGRAWRQRLVETSHQLHAGDVLVAHTDGISRTIAFDRLRALGPQAIADAILTHHAKAHDDAACIVIRC